MEFSSPLLKGTLIKRYKRFLADVELESGEVVTAHCPNTGAMTACAEPGWEVYLRHDPNPKRKLAYTWELCVNDNNEWIGINTHNANKLVAEALDQNPQLLGFSFHSFKSESHIFGSASRFDFLLLDQEKQPVHVVEVKSVTLNDSGIGYFPDAKTTRGVKHCNELAGIVESGLPCTLLFCVQHTGIKEVKPAGHIDIKYAEAVAKAVGKGVSLKAFSCSIHTKNIVLNQSLPVSL